MSPLVRARGRTEGAVVFGHGVLLSDRLGQSPVDYEGLAVGAKHDVGRLDVTVYNLILMCILDYIAYIDETSK